MRLLFLAALTATIVAAPLAAATPDPARVEEAMRLLDAEDFEGATMRASDVSMEAALGVMSEQLKKQFGEALPDDFLDSMREIMRDHARTAMRAKLPVIKRQTAELYAADFTVEELRRLREISGDPVMMKSRRFAHDKQPAMVMLGVNAMRETQGELDAKLKRLVEDYVAKQKGASDS